MVTHSSILAWRIPWTEEPGRLQSMGLKSQTQLQRLTTIISHVCLPPQGATTTTTKSLQSCPTLCDPMDCSPPGSPLPGILQARTLEWVAISFSNAWKWKVKVNSLSRVRLFATPWTAAHQAPPSTPRGWTGSNELGDKEGLYELPGTWGVWGLRAPWLQARIPPALDLLCQSKDLVIIPHWADKVLLISCILMGLLGPSLHGK